MPELTQYNEFDGRHWETGTVANFWAYRGVKAPHTGRPYSEALLLGVSGGAAMGYFTFAYEGYDPTVRILTRNTFDPWMTMLSRLGVAQNVHQTAKPDKAVANLIAALEEGTPAIVWADVWNLPYNALSFDDGMWAMFPILVYGYDETAGVARIADRARVGLTTTAGKLATARGRTKKGGHRLATLEAPNPDKLSAAVSDGIRDSIRLYTEPPPRGSANSFGLKAYHHWAEALTRPKARTSWEREFPAGPKMYAALTSAFTDIALFGKAIGNHADRALYADFLDEAGVILGKPELGRAAGQFRQAATAWSALAEALLPDAVEPFRETRELMTRRHQSFLERGNVALEEMQAIDARLAALKAAIAADFPLTQGEVEAHRARLAGQVMAIHDSEAEAVAMMSTAMA